MIIISGWLRTAEDDRDEYLRRCNTVMASARRAPGCLDFHLSADPIESDRINVYECWASTGDVERFRGSGPSDDLSAMIVAADVSQHEIASSISLT